MIIKNLKCEYAKNPLGLDVRDPQFSWEYDSVRRGFLQISYQLKVSSSRENFNKGIYIWDSGRILSSKSSGIAYCGPPLESRQRYYWKVLAEGNAGEFEESNEPAFFEMGLLYDSDWLASWIGVPSSWVGRVLYFRHSFNLKSPVAEARIYMAGIGYSILFINGERIGDQVLDPGTSEYSKRVLYVVHDITSCLQTENVIGVVVGPGWYGVPKLRLQAEIRYIDGKEQRIMTNWDPSENWWVTTGPIIHSGIFDGETYDARLEVTGWNRTGPLPQSTERTRQWINAVITDSPGGRMVAQKLEPIRVVESFAPVKISEPVPGTYVLDAGRNLAGWISLKVRGNAGTRLVLKFAETLTVNGIVNQENLRSAKAEDVYILKGEGVEQWEPSFTYHGFRFVQVEGFPYHPGLNDFLIRHVRSSVESVGEFSSSDEVLNRIFRMVKNTEANNLHSIPTDCPQRDERMGWLNDMTVRIETALYQFDLSRFYHKFIEDIQDTQAEDGTITDTAPFRWGFRPADPVSASYLLLALKSYEFFGNERILRAHFKGIKAWVDYLYTRTENGIVKYSYWGDWAPPEAYGTPGSVGSGAVSILTPGEFISTGFLYYCAIQLSKIARILKINEDEMRYSKLARKIKIAFNRDYWSETTGGYGSNNQACNSFALIMDLAEKEKRGRIMQNLVRDVERNEYHLTTGNLCTKYLLEALSENGYAHIAYRIAVNQSYPGWGYMLSQGATALWERWENKTGGEMNSHNHPMMGSVASWIFKYLGGIIPGADHPGFEKFIIKPYIIAGLEHLNCEYKSIKGMIRVSWRLKNKELSLHISVPPNSSALVYVPAINGNLVTEIGVPVSDVQDIQFIAYENNSKVFNVGSGDYEFKTNWGK